MLDIYCYLVSSSEYRYELHYALQSHEFNFIRSALVYVSACMGKNISLTAMVLEGWTSGQFPQLKSRNWSSFENYML